MKRFLSIFIALILVLSMFSVTAVAFAEDLDPSESGAEEPSRVKFVATKFEEIVFANRLFNIEMSEDFMIDGKVTVGEGTDAKEVVWYQNEALLKQIFLGINYVELLDEDILDEEDEGFDDATKHTVTYDLDLPDLDSAEDGEGEDETEIELPTAPEEKSYQVTEHVTLADAPKLEGYVFTGWKIEFEDASLIPSEFVSSDYNFGGGFVFNMPDTNVTITATWEKAQADKTVDVKFYANDIVYLLYCNPSSDPKDEMKNWSYCDVNDDFELKTEGEWCFRFAVVDGLADTSTFKYDNVLATSYDNVLQAIKDGEEDENTLLGMDLTLRAYADDTTHPVVELSSSMKDTAEKGLTAGTSYTISTSLEVKDASTWTATFDVYKKVNGEWVLIYDSSIEDTSARVTEGYENCLTVSGSTVRIIPLDSDVSFDPVYKIVYSVKDAKGFYGVESLDSVDENGELIPFSPVLELKVIKAPPATKGGTDAVEAWQIVLYVIAGLAAVGIVVLIFIKPKQKAVEADDARYNASANDEVTENTTDASEDTDNQ